MGEVYRQVTAGIRCPRGPGRPQLESYRPQNPDTGAFLDSDEAPTLVSFDEYCRVDIPFLLAVGAIVPYETRAAAETVTAAGQEPPRKRAKEA